MKFAAIQKIRGGWNNGNAYTVYFSAVFNKPFKLFNTWKNDQLFPSQKKQIDDGKKNRCHVIL